MNVSIPNLPLFHHRSFQQIFFWMLFGVALSTVPLALEVWRIFGTVEDLSTSLNQVLSEGELFLICVALLGASIGELARDKGGSPFFKFSIIGIGFLAAVFCIYAYSVMVNGSDETPLSYYINTSKVCFGMTAVIGMSAVLVNRREK